MSSRRTLILIGAIVVGIFAGVALLNYVRGIEDDIAAEKQSVDVLVATQDIPEGTPAADAINMMAVAQVPLELRPNSFVPVDARESLVGLEARSLIAKNQIIIDGLFVDPTIVAQKFTDQIPAGQVAITLQIAQVNAVGGYLQPGDEVNLLVQHQNLGCDAQEGEDDEPLPDEDVELDAGDNEGASERQILTDENYCTYTTPARYIFQRLEILAIGAQQQLAPGQTGGAITPIGGPITFMVPNQAAQILASLDPDDIYLTLLPEDYQAEALPALTFDLMEGPTPAELAECLTPYGPDGYIAGDAVDAAETVAEGDEPIVTQYTCAELWEG
ncbi:MAG: RcpC/CpaB family pilus assembly protein [Actinomycetota bacterium]